MVFALAEEGFYAEESLLAFATGNLQTFKQRIGAAPVLDSPDSLCSRKPDASSDTGLGAGNVEWAHARERPPLGRLIVCGSLNVGLESGT